MRTVFLNGAYVAENEAQISIFDRGFLFADGVYEVTTVVDGTAPLNEALAALLLAESASVPSRQHSNAGGWHSAKDLLQRTEAPFRSLTGLLTHHLQQGLATLAADRSLGMPEKLGVSAQPPLFPFLILLDFEV